MKKITDKTAIILYEVSSPFKTDFDPPYGPTHIEHPSNKHGLGRCDCCKEDEDER
jgi:hypothetical protein